MITNKFKIIIIMKPGFLTRASQQQQVRRPFPTHRGSPVTDNSVRRRWLCDHTADERHSAHLRWAS